MNLLEKYKRLSDTNKDLSINSDSQGNYYVIKYLHLGVDWDNPLYRQARGLVLNSKGDIVSHPYDKFFNLNELDGRSDLSPEVIEMSHWDLKNKVVGLSEKIDGMLISISYDTETHKLIIASSGNIDPNTRALKRFYNFLNEHELDIKNKLEVYFNNYSEEPNITLMLEFYDAKEPYTIYYGDTSKIYLHGVRNYEGRLLSYKEIILLKNKIFGKDNSSVLIPKDYSKYSEKKLLELSKNETNIEGWVVTFEGGRQLKLKTDDYLKNKASTDIIFGKPDTIAKTQKIIDKYFDNTLDDLIAYLAKNEGGALTLEYINSVIDLIETKIKYGEEISYQATKVLSEGTEREYFREIRAKKELRKNFGPSSIFSIVREHPSYVGNGVEIFKNWWEYNRDNKRILLELKKETSFYQREALLNE